jgi:hypothetical protein
MTNTTTPVTSQLVTTRVVGFPGEPDPAEQLHVHPDAEVVGRARHDGFPLLALCGARRLPLTAEQAANATKCEPCQRLRRILNAARLAGGNYDHTADLVAAVEVAVFSGRLDICHLLERLGFDWVGITSTTTTHAVAPSGLSVCGLWLRRKVWAPARPTCRRCYRMGGAR